MINVHCASPDYPSLIPTSCLLLLSMTASVGVMETCTRNLVMSTFIPTNQPFFLEFNVSPQDRNVHIPVQDLYVYGGGA